MTTLGDATLRLQTDASGLNQGLTQAEKRAESSFKRMAQQARQAGMALTAIGGAAVAGIGASVATFAGFEQKMANVKAVSGATATEFESLSALAKEMGQTTVFTAGQSAEALQFMSMAGMEAHESMNALPDVLNLAAAGQLELGDSADVVTNIMAGFGIQSDDVTRATDVLVTGFTSANTDLLQLGHAFKYAGPVAKSAGLTFEESSAALSLLGNAGLQASMAGTGLRGTITRLISPTSEAQKILDELGVSAVDSSGNMLPLVDIMKQFEDTGLSASHAMTIFGQRAGPAMLALLEQGSGALEELTKDMEESGGTADRIAKTQLDTFSGQLTLLKSALEGVALAIGEAVTPTLREIVEWIAPILQKVAKWIEQNPQLSKTIFLVVAAVGALAFVLGTVLLAIGLLGPAFAVLLGPIGWVVLAIGALVAIGVAVVANWQWVKRMGMRIWLGIGQTVEDSVNSMIDVINILTWHYRKAFKKLVDVAGKVAGWFGKELPDAVVKFANAVDEGIPHVEMFNEESVRLKLALMGTNEEMKAAPSYMDDMVAGYESLAEAAEKARRQEELNRIIRIDQQEQYKSGSEFEDALGMGITEPAQESFEELHALSENQMGRLADITKSFRRAEEDAVREWGKDRADAFEDYSERLVKLNDAEKTELIETEIRHKDERSKLLKEQGEEWAELLKQQARERASLLERYNDQVKRLDADLEEARRKAKVRFDNARADSSTRLEQQSIKSGIDLAADLEEIERDGYRSRQEALRDHEQQMLDIRLDFTRRQEDAAKAERRKLEDIQLDYERDLEEGQRKLADKFGVSFSEFMSGVMSGSNSDWVQENKRLVDSLRRDRREEEQDAEIARARADEDNRIDRLRAEQDARIAHQDKLAEIGFNARLKREEAELGHTERLDALAREHSWRLADIQLERQRTETEAETLHRQGMELADAEYKADETALLVEHQGQLTALSSEHQLAVKEQQATHEAELLELGKEYDDKRAGALTRYRERLDDIDKQFDDAAEARERAHGRRMADIAEEWAGEMTRRVETELAKVTGLAVTEATDLRQQPADTTTSMRGFAGDMIGGLQAFASGGIVKRPMLGMVGEAGPEAIIPLKDLQGMGGGTNIVVNLENAYGFDDFSQKVNDAILLYNRRGRHEVFNPTS